MRITILNFVRKIIIYDTQCSVFVTEVQIRRKVKLIQRFLKLTKDFTNSDLDPVPTIPPLLIINSDADILLTSPSACDDIDTKSPDERVALIFNDEWKIVVDRNIDNYTLIEKLIESDVFMTMISNMKPWGTDEIMMVKVDIYDENKYLCTQLMKILYKDI